MPLDPHVQRLLFMLAAGSGEPAGSDMTERRNAYAQMMDTVRPKDLAPCDTKDIVITGPAQYISRDISSDTGGSLPLRLYTPPDPGLAPAPALIYLHGGGWVTGSLDTHDSVCHSLCASSACRVVSVDYRLAPEHKHPARLLDAETATRWIVAQAPALGIDAARLGVSGDSAGANLAAALCQLFRQKGEAPFALQLLLCPFLDLVAQTDSRRAFGQGYFMDLAPMARDLALCIDEHTPWTDPTLSPLRAGDFAGLPPAHIHTAEFDPMRDEGLAYAEKLIAAGVAARHVGHSGMIHQFYAMGGVIPYAKTAMREIGASAGAALRAPRQ